MSHVITAPAESVDEGRLGFRNRWYRETSFVAGVGILALLALMAFLAPALSRYNPITQDPSNILQMPSTLHWLGTDHLGRDVWVRLWVAARIDLVVGALAIVTPFVVGTVLGCLAAYFGGWWDRSVMRLVDVVVAFPYYVLVIAMVFALGPGAPSIIIAIALVGWVSYTRIIRAEVLVARQHDYALAARAAGLSHIRVIVRHIIPNTIQQSIVYAMSDIVMAILAIVTLGYLGLGVEPPTPDWGQMIADGQAFIMTNWMLSTIPGIAVIITGLGLSLLGDGLAALLEPE